MGKTRAIKESVLLSDERLLAASRLIDKKIDELKAKYDSHPLIDDKVSVLNELEDFCDGEILFWIHVILVEEDKGTKSDETRIDTGYRHIRSFEKTVKNISKLRKGLFAIQHIKEQDNANN
jgi:hypothetical protein